MIRLLVVLTFLTSCAVANEATEINGKPAPLTSTATIDQVLDALDNRGHDLKAFTADVKLTETDAATGDDTTRTGKVWYQLQENGSTRIRVLLDSKQANGKITEDKIEYLLSGVDLIDRNYHGRTQVTRHILKPGETLNLFKLGEGPFPLPIGQKREDVLKSFEVSKLDPQEKAPQAPGVKHIPAAETQFARRLNAI